MAVRDKLGSLLGSEAPKSRAPSTPKPTLDITAAPVETTRGQKANAALQNPAMRAFMLNMAMGLLGQQGFAGGLNAGLSGMGRYNELEAKRLLEESGGGGGGGGSGGGGSRGGGGGGSGGDSSGGGKTPNKKRVKEIFDILESSDDGATPKHILQLRAEARALSELGDPSLQSAMDQIQASVGSVRTDGTTVTQEEADQMFNEFALEPDRAGVARAMSGGGTGDGASNTSNIRPPNDRDTQGMAGGTAPPGTGSGQNMVNPFGRVNPTPLSSSIQGVNPRTGSGFNPNITGPQPLKPAPRPSPSDNWFDFNWGY